MPTQSAVLQALIQSIADQKAELDRLRPLSEGALKQLQAHYDVELTYLESLETGTLRKGLDTLQWCVKDWMRP